MIFGISAEILHPCGSENIMIKGDADFSNGQGPLVALIDVGNAIKSEKKTVHRQLCQ